MREILFRGFREDKDGKEKVFYNGAWHNGEWAEGCYFMAKDNKYNILHCISEIQGERIFKVVPETVGQYTGLRDKNGTKIFEGDIVETVYDGKQNPNYVVVWDKDELDFKATNGKEHYKTNYEYLGCCDEIVVIGNIHSNPEILEVE